MTSNDPVDILRRLMQTRIYDWSHRKEKPQAQPGPVLTISREPGSGGESLAETLSAELQLHLYTWDIVEQIAKDEHVSTQVVSTLDEKARSEFEDWLADFQGTHSLSSYAYLHDLKRIIFTIASHGSALILGRGANFCLPAEKRIGLYLVAPLEVRIRNVMEDRGVSEKQAREDIAKQAAEQRRFVKKYFQAEIQDPTHYHLVINTALVNPQTLVGIVREIINHRS
jgi:cytidylate kinase